MYFCAQSDGRCVVVDTNVVLHQIDFLESASSAGGIANVVLTQTVLEEAKHRNLSIYNRVKKMVGHRARLFFVFANENHADTFVQVAAPWRSDTLYSCVASALQTGTDMRGV